jgi:hypothetical protein
VQAARQLSHKQQLQCVHSGSAIDNRVHRQHAGLQGPSDLRLMNLAALRAFLRDLALKPCRLIEGRRSIRAKGPDEVFLVCLIGQALVITTMVHGPLTNLASCSAL